MGVGGGGGGGGKRGGFSKAVGGERSVSLVHNGGSFHSPVSRARVHSFRPSERTTPQDAPGSMQSDPDDPEVVPVCSIYGSFQKPGVKPRTLATAPERFAKCR